MNSNELSSDPQIEAYLRFLTRELAFSGNPADLRRYLSAYVAYAEYRRSGSQAARFYTWYVITEAFQGVPGGADK